MKGIESKLLDSSIWLSYFYAEMSDVKEMIESDTILYTSSLTIFEVKRKLNRDRQTKKMQKVMDFIKERGMIVDVTEEIAENAADLSAKFEMHAMDALIYACALSVNAQLITGDPHFRGIEGVKLIEGSPEE
nr:PIN domain-containing protein [Candidatus Njordarchaeota archaeon]